MSNTWIQTIGLTLVLAGSVQGAVINATPDSGDGWFNNGGTVNTNQRLFVGDTNDNATGSRNGMAVFVMPAIPAGHVITSAEFAVELNKVNLLPDMDVDLYLMRTSAANTFGGADYYSGAFAGPGVADGSTGAIGVMDDFLEYVSPQPPFGVYSTGVGSAESNALGALLDGTSTGEFILLRLSHDLNPAPNFHLARFTDEGLDSGTIAPRLTITTELVPEPTSTILCLLMAMAVVAFGRTKKLLV